MCLQVSNGHCKSSNNFDTEEECLDHNGHYWCGGPEPPCADNPDFEDAQSFDCAGWGGFDCTDYQNWGYSDEEGAEIMAACPETCGTVCDADAMAQLVPAGGALGTCLDISSCGLAYGANCIIECNGDESLPVVCNGGTLLTPAACCAPGTTWSGDNGTACAQCLPGKFDDDNDSATPCVDCVAGRFSAEVGVAGSCEGVCSPGTEGPSGSTSADLCIGCASGTSDHDSDPTTPCDTCAPGRYSAQVGVDGPCDEVCSPGTYAPLLTTQCADQHPMCGEFVSCCPGENGASGCGISDCSNPVSSGGSGNCEGTWMAAQCAVSCGCPLTHIDWSEDAAFEFCEACPEGQADLDSDVSTVCEPCPQGQFSDGADVACQPCPGATPFSNAGSSSTGCGVCTSTAFCEDDMWCVSGGASTGAGQCVSCLPGRYCGCYSSACSACELEPTIVSVQVFIYPYEVSWFIETIGDYSSIVEEIDYSYYYDAMVDTSYYYDAAYSESFQHSVPLATGLYALHFADSFGDGWHGGSITIAGLVEPIEVQGSGGNVEFEVLPAPFVAPEDCVAGTYDHDGSPCTSCIGCQPGFTSIPGATECFPVCLPGSFANSSLDWTTADSDTDCEPCPAGQYDDDQIVSTPCIDCAAGMYRSHTNNATSCLSCPADWPISSAGAASVAQCGACSITEMCDSDSLWCVIDPAGSPGVCDECQPGSFCGCVSSACSCTDSTALTIYITIGDYAEEISWTLANSNASLFDPIEKPPYWYEGSYGSMFSEEVEVPPGDYTLTYADTFGDGWNGGSIAVFGHIESIEPTGYGGSVPFSIASVLQVTAKQECPFGSYDDDLDACTPCTACPVGQYSNLTGSISLADCQPICSTGTI